MEPEMSKFTIHTKETAPAEALPALEKAEKKFGRIPNLIGGLSEAPVAAEAYLTLSELVSRSSFTPAERHVVWFTVNSYHDCRYCMAAHTAIAKMESVDDAVIDAARNVESYDDPRLESLRQFTLSIVEKRGWVNDEETESFLAAGFTRQQILEIVTIIAQKVMSNYTNHLIETPVDDAFAKFAWEKPESVSA